MFFIIIFTMIKIYVYSCLLSALSFVEMKPLNVRGCVGEIVTFKCSDWNNLFDVRYHDKYFCRRPCTEDKHIIIKAAPGKSTQQNRIRINNRGKDLFVTFTNLKKSDAKTYYCGVERNGPDILIEVNLKVTDAASYGPKKTPETVDTFTTLSSAVSNSSTLSSNNKHNITDVSASNTTLNTPTPSAPATQAAGSVPYLIAGLIFTFALVMVVLLLTRKLMKRGQRDLDVSSPHEDIYDSARPDEVYQSLRPLTMDEDQVYSSLTEGSALHTTLDNHCSRK